MILQTASQDALERHAGTSAKAPPHPPPEFTTATEAECIG